MKKYFVLFTFCFACCIFPAVEIKITGMKNNLSKNQKRKIYKNIRGNYSFIIVEKNKYFGEVKNNTSLFFIQNKESFYLISKKNFKVKRFSNQSWKKLNKEKYLIMNTYKVNYKNSLIESTRKSIERKYSLPQKRNFFIHASYKISNNEHLLFIEYEPNYCFNFVLYNTANKRLYLKNYFFKKGLRMGSLVGCNPFFYENYINFIYNTRRKKAYFFVMEKFKNYVMTFDLKNQKQKILLKDFHVRRLWLLKNTNILCCEIPINQNKNIYFLQKIHKA